MIRQLNRILLITITFISLISTFLIGQTLASPSLISGDVVPDGSVTVSATWSWQSSAPETILLVGIAPQVSPQSPYISLQLVKDAAGWFPTWKLQLAIRESADNDRRYIDLRKGSFTDGQHITAALSYHPITRILSIALYDEDSHIALYTTGHTLAIGKGPYVPIATVTSGTESPSLQGLQAIPAYQPVADHLEIGEVGSDDTFIPVTAFEHRQKANVRVTPAIASPGEYVLTLVTGSGRRQEVARFTPGQTEHMVPLPIESMEPGSATLLTEYRENDVTLFSQTSQLTVGKVGYNVQFTSFDRQKGTITGTITASSSMPLPGIQTQIQARYTLLKWDAYARTFRDEPQDEVFTVLAKPADELAAGSPYPFSVAMPALSGIWKLELSASTDPKIISSITGGQEQFANRTKNPDYPIAGTNQSNLRIEIFAPDADDWSKPGAIQWSWGPTRDLGYSWAEISFWRGPSDVKLRNSSLWGGQYLVATAGDLATIAAYPSGERKWAAYVGGNPHAVELLPDGNIAVAASTGGWVRVYTSSQGPNSAVYTQFDLPGAHGVLWDPSLQILWALGDYELIALRIKGSTDRPIIEKAFTKKLPSNWGHDLFPVYGDIDRLWVTTGSHVYQYVKSTGEWLADYLGARNVDRVGVKSVGNQPSGQIVLTQPKEGSLYSWSTDAVQLFFPGATRVLPKAAFYKARIWSPDYQ